ncbi:MAG: SPOR domain-containing protein [Spirochaetia bacterium]|jgi:DedD protein|nr:SPOR domain-containing protein [Spirochaetia bacterium]
MEQKKILWILLSVTLFLFIVSITGVVWFYPGRISVAKNTDTNSPDNQDQAAIDFDPVEWVREGENFPGLTDSPPNEEEGFAIVYGETGNGETVVNLVADNTVKEVDDKISSSVVREPETKINEPVKVVSTSVSNVAAPAPKLINVLEYWIQAGSFSSRSRAESASETLSDKGFSNLITIKSVDSNDYFRVRMGPYASKAEAGKFLNWIKEIDSYEKSYISQVYVQKTVN